MRPRKGRREAIRRILFAVRRMGRHSASAICCSALRGAAHELGLLAAGGVSFCAVAFFLFSFVSFNVLFSFFPFLFLIE